MRTFSKAAAGVIAILALGALSQVVQAQQSGPERDLFNSVNRERRAHGLRPLKWDDALAVAARQHALEMAQQGAISHQFSGEPSLPTRARKAGARFSWLSENVTQGPNTANIHTQFMNSPSHRANLLDVDMDSAGFAVVEHGGRLSAVEDFSKAK